MSVPLGEVDAFGRQRGCQQEEGTFGGFLEAKVEAVKTRAVLQLFSSLQ